MTFRNFARVSATGLLAAGSLALAAVPAFAADVDFGLDVRGTTIAADASGKLGFITVTNDGTTKPSDVEVLFDVKNLDQTKVKIDLGDCTFANDVADCALDPMDIPGPGASSKLPIPLEKQDGATGAAGKLTITVKVAGDTNPDNDSKTVDVTVGGHGVDLTLVANDVYKLPSKESESFTDPVPPGGQGLLTGFVLNQGDAVAEGLKIGFTLPKDVTITDDLEGCTLSADRRSADCAINDLTLVPVDQAQGGNNAGVGFGVVVTVSKDAKGPVSLKGGEMAVAAINQEIVSEKQMQSMARRARSLPKGFRNLTADELKAVEVDATDNTDTFAVIVAGPQGGGGGGGGGDNGGGDDNGGLPVTGPVAASVAGVGGAVIVIGAALFFVARRRRVVVVTPSDDK